MLSPDTVRSQERGGVPTLWIRKRRLCRMKGLGLGHAAAQGQSQENPVSQLGGCRAFFFPYFSSFHGAGYLEVLTLKHLVEGLFLA